MAPKRRTVPCRLRLRPDHEPGRVAQRHHGQPPGLAQPQEPGGLVRALGVDRPAQVQRVAGEHADWPAVEAAEDGEHRPAVVPQEFQAAAFIEQGVDHRADVVGAQPVLRDEMTLDPLVGGRAGDPLPRQQGQRGLCGGDGRALVGDEDVDHPVGRLHVHRPDLLRRVHAEAAALDHRRAAHAEA